MLASLYTYIHPEASPWDPRHRHGRHRHGIGIAMVSLGIALARHTMSGTNISTSGCSLIRKSCLSGSSSKRGRGRTFRSAQPQQPSHPSSLKARQHEHRRIACCKPYLDRAQGARSQLSASLIELKQPRANLVNASERREGAAATRFCNPVTLLKPGK